MMALEWWHFKFRAQHEKKHVFRTGNRHKSQDSAKRRHRRGQQGSPEHLRASRDGSTIEIYKSAGC